MNCNGSALPIYFLEEYLPMLRRSTSSSANLAVNTGSPAGFYNHFGAAALSARLRSIMSFSQPIVRIEPTSVRNEQEKEAKIVSVPTPAASRNLRTPWFVRLGKRIAA